MDCPAHLKFGYQHMLEMRQIEADLRATGFTGSALHFAAVGQYEARHKDDPTYRERSHLFAEVSTSAPDQLRHALEQIRDGHNDPRTLAATVLAELMRGKG